MGRTATGHLLAGLAVMLWGLLIPPRVHHP